jgi:hypothetical protein
MIPQLTTNEPAVFYNPDDWKPNRAQSKFLALWHSKKYPIVAAMMGWGTGKTRLLAYLMQSSFEADPGVNGAYVTDSLGRGAKTIALECQKLLEPLGWTYHHYFKGAPAPHWLSPTLDGKQSIVWVLSWKRPSTKSAAANSLEGPDLGWILLDEANQMDTSEIGTAMLGRVRSGKPGRVGILGKPTFSPWQREFAESRSGVFFTASSRCNRENIPNFNAWLSSLSRREILENIDANPQPPVGSIFTDWVPEAFPHGNLAPVGWKPEPWMQIHAAFDFGVRHPAALLLAHDPTLGPNGADVVFGEAMPDEASVFDVCRMLRSGIKGVFPGVWPANRLHDMPAGSLPLHAIYGDRAGRNRRDDQSLTSAMGDVLQSPLAGGLGLRVFHTDDPRKVNVLGGVKLLWRLMCNNKNERRLLCTQKLWHMGSQSGGRSFARSINEYRWASAHKDTPDKTNGADHAADALRYWAINARWPADVGMHEARAAFKQSAPQKLTIQPVGSDR